METRLRLSASGLQSVFPGWLASREGAARLLRTADAALAWRLGSAAGRRRPAAGFLAPMDRTVMDFAGLGAFALLCFSSLLAIINPLMAAPIFLSLTDGYTPAHREHTLRTAAITGAATLVIFALLGGAIFQVFGITIHAFRIAGGLMLFGIGMDMLQAKPSRVRATPEEESEGLRKDDVAITPLGVPILVGPGSITTVMVLMGDARGPLYVVTLLVTIGLTLAGTYLLLNQGQRILRLFGRTGLNVMTRIMGLLVAVIAVQFVLDGVRPVLIDILRQVG